MNDQFSKESSISTPAATVILTREQFGSLQVYLLKRNLKSGFMAGNFVFPGGAVDRNDRYFRSFESFTDMTPEEITVRFGPELSAEQALPYCVAAIRETLEEAGVFLTRRDNISAADLERINRLRLAEGLTNDWLIRVLEDKRWCLSLSSLFCWSHWVTPIQMNRRFDTRFFVADMPADQECQPDARETVAGQWITPEQALSKNMSGEIPLSPPTLVSLHELMKYPDLESLKAEADQRQWGAAIQPRLVPLSNGAVIVEPWDPMYHQKKIDINPENLPSSVLPVGSPFSRIWLDRGIWKPIGL